MNQPLRLSVLDQSPILEGVGEDVSIRETLAMARHCDALGYHRFWMSEHHGSGSLAGSAPEILVAAVAMKTSRIRVGTAGILLPHYAPLKVAEQFRVLEALAPGRIDLGVGRAPGSDGRMAYALNPSGDAAVERFPTNVRDLVAWTSGRPLPADHPFATLTVSPQGPTAPEVWVLGSSTYGAQVAAYLGLPYCYAAFIGEGGAEEALDVYRRAYQPSERHPEPYATACVFALAANSEAQARHLFGSRARARLNRDRGIRRPLLPPDAAERVPLAPGEQGRLDTMLDRALIGDGPGCARKLRAYASGLGLDELTILTHVFALEDRMRSFTLLADAFGLTLASAIAAPGPIG